MMRQPLLISALLQHAARCHGATDIVSRLPEGGLHRYNYAEAYRRAGQVARLLRAVGVRASDRAGTIAWNTHRHLEIYYGASGSGVVVHTINPRLPLEQLAYVINHADDRVVLFDVTFLPLVEAVAARCPGVRCWIALADRAHLPPSALPVMSYEEMLAAEDGDFAWPQLDENCAAALCYTSGTTGNPKGVLYSHRSTVLHAYASSLPDAFGLRAADVVLPIVPMFHVNAWGIPYSAPLNGAKLVLPGPGLDGASLCELITQEAVTLSGGVPTVWQGILQHLEKSGMRLSLPHRTIIGGSALPSALARALLLLGVEVRQGWGMTELSPMGVVNAPKHHRAAPLDARVAAQLKQGRALPGIELKIVGADGAALPSDGEQCGELLVRGHWVGREYFRGEESEVRWRDGWFATGDVATVNPDGFVQIVDRSKDLVKSGGEWISSIALENEVMRHPAVAQAAVIGVPHPRWGERPLAVVTPRPGATVTPAEVIAFLVSRVPKWWVPDDVVFVATLPLSGTGKVLKKDLRETYRAHYGARRGSA